MSEINTPSEQSAEQQQIELLDCGQASKMTKGFLFFILFESTIPPFDRMLMM